MSGLRMERAGEVLRITLDRPEKRNAIGASEWEVLRSTAGELRASEEIQVVVLQASGNIFSAGVDLDLIAEARKDPHGLVALIESNGAVVEAFEQLPQILIVALNGPAIGIAVHFAMAADFVLATNDVYLQLPEARLGVPDVMHIRVMERRLGRGAALAFTLLGERLTASQATAAGLLYRQYADLAGLAAGIDELLGALHRVKPAVRRQVKLARIDHSAMTELQLQIRAVRDL